MFTGRRPASFNADFDLNARVGIEHNIRFGYSEFYKNINKFKDYSSILAITFHYLPVLSLTVSLTVKTGF
jgi:hypothetical protein